MKGGFEQFEGRWEANSRLAWDTIAMKPCRGIPAWLTNPMQWSLLEDVSGNPRGSYPREPVRVYLEYQIRSGTCYLDQWIPENPLSIREQGYGDGAPRGATTGAEEIVRDGMRIDSPEAVVEHMEKHLFALQADVALAHNRIAARAIVEGGLPRLVRLDHDMADSRGTLADPVSLDRLWFPHFARAIGPFLDAGIRLIWHCDGNLMAMVPRLIEAGISGFQGFQYEDGMDYPAICRMKDRDGNPLFIVAGVSVTRTLPHGTPADVRREMRWLVDNGPKVGLMLGCSSSVAPGVPRQNMDALIEGFAYYRERGRG